jgi:hypothetical protein
LKLSLPMFLVFVNLPHINVPIGVGDLHWAHEDAIDPLSRILFAVRKNQDCPASKLCHRNIFDLCHSSLPVFFSCLQHLK